MVVLGFGLRLYKIENPVADWHSWRQVDTASVSRSYVENGVDLLYPRYHDISTVQTGYFNPDGLRFVELPIYNAVHAFLYKNLSGITLETWGRLLSIFCSLISSLCLFILGKRFIGVWGGILASFYYLTLPFNIYFTRVILPEPMATTLGLLSLVFFVSFIDSERKWELLLSGIFMSLAILVKPFVLFYSVPMIYLIIKKYGFKNIFKDASILIPLLIFVDIVLIPFILWRAWINQFPQGIPYYLWAFNGDKIRFKPSFWNWIFGERFGQLILGSWGLIPLGFGLITKAKSYFNHLFILGVVLYVFVIATANVRHDYYQTITIPGISLMLAQGSLFMWNTDKFKKILARGLLIFSVAIMFVSGFVQIKEFYKINHPEIIKAGNAADKITPKNALVIAPYNGDTAFLYQTKRWGWPFVDRDIEELIEKGANYYVSVNYDDLTNQLLKKFKVIEQTSDYVIIDLGDRVEK